MSRRILVLSMLFAMPSIAGNPLHPIPPGLDGPVREIDKVLPKSSGDTRSFVSDLLNLGKSGEATPADRLSKVENGIFCFWVAVLRNFAEQAVRDGAWPGSGVHTAHTYLTSVDVRFCRGPGGKAADAEHELIGEKLVGALNDLRVQAAVERVLQKRGLSPQTMHSLPASPPPAGASRALAVTGLATLVVIGLMNPFPEEAITWPALYAAMRQVP